MEAPTDPRRFGRSTREILRTDRGAEGHQSAALPRRGFGVARRQWRRQVDPDEDLHRLVTFGRAPGNSTSRAALQFRSVSHARSLGIEAVYQDLALINQLNVYRNMFLQREPVSAAPLGILTSARCAGRRSPAREHEGTVRPVDVDVALSSREVSARPSPSRAQSSRRPRCCCSTSRPPRWSRNWR